MSSAGQYSRTDSADFGPLKASASAVSNVIVAPFRSQRPIFPHLTQHGFDSIAAEPSYWASKTLSDGMRGAALYRGRLTAVGVLLAIIAVLLAIPVTPFP